MNVSINLLVSINEALDAVALEVLKGIVLGITINSTRPCYLTTYAELKQVKCCTASADEQHTPVR